MCAHRISKLHSFGELRALVGAGAPDAAGAGASVVVKDETTVSSRARQGSVAVGDGRERVDRVRRSRLHVWPKVVGVHTGVAIRVGLGRHRVPAGDKVRQLVKVLELVKLDLAAQRLKLAEQSALASVLAGVGELWDHDGRQNAKDDHDDQNFDERKARLTIGDTSEHGHLRWGLLPL